jgi:hypothetical protein
MTNQTLEEKIYEEARLRVKAKKDFYGHLTAWAIVNAILIIVWALTDLGGYPWFLWCLCIWGVFVFINYLRVFVFKQKSDSIAIEKEVERIKKERSQ